MFQTMEPELTVLSCAAVVMPILCSILAAYHLAPMLVGLDQAIQSSLETTIAGLD
jgi:hypothetical protein